MGFHSADGFDRIERPSDFTRDSVCAYPGDMPFCKSPNRSAIAPMATIAFAGSATYSPPLRLERGCAIFRHHTQIVISNKGYDPMTLRELLTDIHALEEELLAFERKYGLRSETFYAAYIAGEEPEDDNWVLDFGEWAAVYRAWLARQADYRNEIQRIRPRPDTLIGLIQTTT
jgi:hypothetical protein